MAFHVSHLVRMLFVGGTMILVFANAYEQKYSEDDDSHMMVESGPKSEIVRTSYKDPNVSTSAVNYEAIPKKHMNLLDRDHIFRLLSPDIFSDVDPFQHLIRETANLARWEMVELDKDLEFRLKNNQFPEIYIPYAEALRSILRFQAAVQGTKTEIRRNRAHPNRSIIPAKISSPAEFSESGLFSRDIFFDSDPPIELINKLMKIPRNGIPKLITKLENYTKLATEWKKAPYSWWKYKLYAEDLLQVLKTNIFDDLERNMTEIRRISTIGSRSSETTGSNGAT